MSLRGLKDSITRRGSGNENNRNGNAYAVVSLTPILVGRESVLKEHLRSLAPSPFAELAEVHFARFMVLGQLNGDWPGAPRRRTELKSAYLLFTASITANDDAGATALPGTFLERIAQQVPEAASAIWNHCLGFPGVLDPGAFADYLHRSLLGSELFYVGYKDATVQQVRDALARRSHLCDFAQWAQDQTDQTLVQQRYLSESTSWGF
jgi:hypothetical protein